MGWGTGRGGVRGGVLDIGPGTDSLGGVGHWEGRGQRGSTGGGAGYRLTWWGGALGRAGSQGEYPR